MAIEVVPMVMLSLCTVVDAGSWCWVVDERTELEGTVCGRHAHEQISRKRSSTSEGK